MICIFCILPTLAAQALAAQESEFRLQGRWGISWLGQATATNNVSTPNPDGISSSQIIHHFGIGAHISFSPLLGIAPSIDVYFDEYIYLSEFMRAFPTQSQTGSGIGPLATVLSLGINLPWYMSVPVGEFVHFDLAVGLGLVFRIPVAPLDGSGDISPIGDYVLGNGRWLNIYIQPGFRFRLAEWFGFSVSPTAIIPIWHIFDNEELMFYDNLQLGGTIGFDFYL